ncbi:MAG: hypothetical protein CM15mP59_4260 [Flavobacteriaceae bacterium]|nr:MAG: hypothetical protein CM15mP59_4260 [Flavobacteriaceae bacterium]
MSLYLQLKMAPKSQRDRSGTEPKIKFYFSVHCPFNNRLEYTALRSDLIDSIDRMCVQLGLTA